MPSPSSPSNSIDPTSCPHGPRAGTTTCLYCRNEARALARQKRNRLLARIGLFAMGGATAIALIVGAIISIVPAGGAGVGATTTAEVVSTAPTPEKPVFVLEPIIPEGRSTLGDSIVFERTGGDVTVHFDTETLRTRYDWKFEGTVRYTLPQIYGADARVALDSIPSGYLVRGGNLIRELPTRGIPIALSDSRSLTVWPITRPGLDGPLVVGYRASATRN